MDRDGGALGSRFSDPKALLPIEFTNVSRCTRIAGHDLPEDLWAAALACVFLQPLHQSASQSALSETDGLAGEISRQ